MSLYTDASLIMYPSGYKEDKIYSLKPTDGSGDLTFTRASTATRVNSDGLIETSPVNLFEYSQSFTNGVWVGVSASYSGDTLTASSGTSFKGLYQNQTTQGQQTVFFDVLYSSHQWVQIGLGTGASDLGFANFDVQNKVLGNTSGGFVNSIQDFGTYIRITSSFSSVDKTSVFLCMVDSGTASRADGTSSTGAVKLFKSQLNIGSTAKPYFPTTDRLNVPRIDYTSGCGKLLLEPQRTNIALRSNELSTAPNVIDGTTATVNFYTSPDGTTNAIKLAETTANDRHGFYQYYTVTAQTYTVSVFTKQIGRRYISLMSDFTGTNTFSYFDLQNKVVVSNGSGYTCSIEEFSDGWLRLSATVNAISGSRYTIWGGSTNGTTNTYVGNTSTFMTFYGLQVEAGSYPTSYIPTSGTAVTRVADAINQQIVGLTTITAGTFFLDFYRGVSVATARDSSTDGFFYRSSSSFPSGSAIEISTDAIGIARVGIRNSGLFFIAANQNNTLNHIKIAVKWDGVNLKVFANGVLQYNNPFVFANAFQYLGYNPDFKKEVQSVMIFPAALSDAELLALTTI